ncbi:hypothetical protein FHX15_001278 [Rhizobium sp. BK650]|uniref:hypothetical protein n=1 Tax=Rhizobium sp. BK650 TaxID=2586990 RepID=UPI00162069AA|nr:hypothetical protein [Rhizobium sp. BK650]MBB3656065.1 hypothetical protein [Rhizobium sp. BK650]
MKTGIVSTVGLVAMIAALTGCVDRANAPVLVPVASPVNPPDIAHSLCVSDANAMYDEADRQYDLRAQMTGHRDAVEKETNASGAARRQYLSCIASQGYRPLYAN